MISGTTIVWCGTQDSTIMDGRHTSGIFTVQTKFPPMLQLPVRAIIAICLRHILPSARESRSTVRPWLSWRISAQLVWRLDWTYMRDFIMPSICSSCSLSILPHLPSVLSAASRPGPSSCSLPSTPRRTRDIKNYVDAINDDGHPHDLFMAQGGFAIDERLRKGYNGR